MVVSLSTPPDEREGPGSTLLTLKIWHPECWTLNLTDRIDAGLIGHGVYEIDDVLQVRFTAYADDNDTLGQLVSEIRESALTDRCRTVNEFVNDSVYREGAGNTTQEILVEYAPEYSIHDPIVSQGFVPDGAIRIHDGYEYWTVISETREGVERRLDAVREDRDAEISVQGMKSASTTMEGPTNWSDLSERQREVFQLAKRRGYYSWPRQVSASELAEELSISKTTLLEHLRKAETKILSQIQP